MSDKRKSGQVPDWDVNALFDDPEDELESGAAIANARASLALGGSIPDDSSPTASSTAEGFRIPRPTGAATQTAPVPESTPPSSHHERQDTILDLDREAQLPAVLAPGAPRSNSRPSNRPPTLRRSEPAPPMAVPSLRPPAATPPPVRLTLPPPTRGSFANQELTGTEPTPRAPRSLPPAAPAPTLPWHTPHADAENLAPAAGPAPSSAAVYDAPTQELSADLLRAATAELTDSAQPNPSTALASAGGTLLGPPAAKFATDRANSFAPSGNRSVPQQLPPGVARAATLQGVGPGIMPTNVAAAGLTSQRVGSGHGPTTETNATRANPAGGLARARSELKAWLWTGLGLLAAAALLVVWRSLPKAPGDLVVSVSSPSSQAIPKLNVLVDGEPRCTYSPCRVSGLAKGSHVLSAEAPDFLPSEPLTLVMTPGTDLTQNIVLEPQPRQAALTVTVKGAGLEVFVDDKSLGPAPIVASPLDPGEHTVRVEGDRFETLSELVSVEPGERKSIGPLTPKVKLGQLTVALGTNAANATITLDGKPLTGFPNTLDLDASRPHTLVAEKPDFDRFEQEIVFPDGRPEVRVNIVLLESDSEEADEGQDSQQPGTNAATLSMNSIPASRVLLDGKDLGSTPQAGIKVPAGRHTVTFVHPKRGKKKVSVRVKPGERRNVSARY